MTEDTRLTQSEIEDAKALMTGKITIVRSKGTFGEYLNTGITYQGPGFIVYRRQVDEIDNLYIEESD